MADRNYIEQSLHDRVIQSAYQQLDKIQHDVYTNPGISKNISIGDNYPDIIITEKGKFIAKYIIEVETFSSVTINEAVSQWKKFAAEINTSFYLLVPESSKNAAINLCKSIGISVRFGTYVTDHEGTIISIKYE